MPADLEPRVPLDQRIRSDETRTRPEIYAGSLALPHAKAQACLGAVRRLRGVERKANVRACPKIELRDAACGEVIREDERPVAAELTKRRVEHRRWPGARRNLRKDLPEADWTARAMRAPEEKEPIPRKADVGAKAPTEMNAVDERRLDGVRRDIA